MTAKKLCIYHANCPDGFGAALAVYRHPDWGRDATQFHPAHYGSAPPDITGKDVIIVDFSYSRAVLEAMHKQANSLLVIDHHKTAQAELEGLPYCIFDMTKSGAMLTWLHLYPNHPWDATPPEHSIPAMISFIQDRDLWVWEMYKSREYNAALASYPLDFELWEELLDNNEVDRLRLEGEAILRYQNKQVATAVASWKKSPKYIELPSPPKEGGAALGTWIVPIFNATQLISEICGELAAGFPFACTYFDTNGLRIYSLRKRGNEYPDVDVAEIAKYIAAEVGKFDVSSGISGGGHASAAGFSLPQTISPCTINYHINRNQ